MALFKTAHGCIDVIVACYREISKLIDWLIDCNHLNVVINVIENHWIRVLIFLVKHPLWWKDERNWLNRYKPHQIQSGFAWTQFSVHVDLRLSLIHSFRLFLQRFFKSTTTDSEDLGPHRPQWWWWIFTLYWISDVQSRSIDKSSIINRTYLNRSGWKFLTIFGCL